MAYGPHAIARHAGKVLFVRGGAPAEELTATIREERATYAYADVTAVVRPSPDRRVAPCPYLPRCGGCPWQHLTYRAQLAAKTAAVAELLRRIGRIAVRVEPTLPSPQEFGYRGRLKLRAGGGQVGFYAAASHELVPVAHCLLAEPAVDLAVEAVAALVRGLETAVRRIEIVAGDEAPGVVVLGEAEGRWEPADEARAAAWRAAHRTVRGLVLRGRGWRRAWGDDRVAVWPEPDLPLTVRAGTFSQVNPAANQLLVRTVLALLAPAPGERVLDLYAGAGNFALPIARRRVAVTAIEQHAQAAADGRANAARAGLAACHFRTGRVERELAALVAAGAPADAIVLDPPRSGAAAALAGVLRLAPARLVYVSCDPATLARDLARLGAAYRIDTVQPIDLFPHTYHVETVVRATRRAR
jgi:23S rRNA (uracil1939-C5)-methyltransferase